MRLHLHIQTIYNIMSAQNSVALVTLIHGYDHGKASGRYCLGQNSVAKDTLIHGTYTHATDRSNFGNVLITEKHQGEIISVI